MEFITSFREALLNLLSAKLRSFLAILGILVGTGSVVALISSSELATAHALAQFKKLGTNLISLNLQDSGNENNQQRPEFKLNEINQLKNASAQIVLVAPYTTQYHAMYFGSLALNGQTIGAGETFSEIAKAHIASGRFVSYLDHRNFYCVIGSKLAEKIEKTGAKPLHNQILINKELFTIVGVLKPWPSNLFIPVDLNNSAIIPIETSLLLDKNTQINSFLIRLVKNPNVALAKQEIISFIHTILPKKKTNFMSPEQLVNLIAKSRATYTMLLIAIGSISLIVGGIGVMNIMLVSVIERRREIGIRAAIGARQSDILRMFLVESIALTLFGGFLGVVFGIFTSFILALFSHWQFHLYPVPIVLGFSVSILVGVLSGFYPALRASKLDPIQAMNL